MTSASDLKQWVSEALSAISGATDLEGLKSARIAHSGDKSPVALASRGLGSLSSEEKASAGKLIGEARAAITAAR